MGNDSSKLKGLVIEEAVEANDFWMLLNAESPTTSNEEGRQLLSIFQGEPVVSGQLWVAQGPMERAIKNLKIYRHPYILKYVTTWDQGGQKHLATERVRPLSTVLSTQSDIQVCLGLRTILCSLIFLIEKAMARHLNICIASIYITDNGSWRLAGFEYVWKSKDVTQALLDFASAFRYQAAIDPEESQQENCYYIEQYAFSTLCEEILNKCTNTDTATPHVAEFREYCATHLKHKNAQMRPTLSAVLLHPYFNHEFVLIHSFLFELPLKSLQEKQDFFTGLIDRLRYFNEDVVGAHLAADLLSRMVLLDPTAQLCVTPYVMKTKTDHSAALFSNATYMRYLMPHLKKMFRLRDAQIRLILLEYFVEFVRLLPKEELLEFILPHLLAGMNDTNDVLVAKTLRCLADMVPLLGAATVLGGQRLRLFSDGRPQAAVPDSTTHTHWVEPRSITPVMGMDGDRDYMVSSSPLPDIVDEFNDSFSSLPHTLAAEILTQLEMPPRLSPDGGEDDKSAINADAQIINTNSVATANALHLNVSNNNSAVDDNEEPWPDWESDELQRLNGQVSSQSQLALPVSTTSNTELAKLQLLSNADNSFAAPGTVDNAPNSQTDVFCTPQSSSTQSLKVATNTKEVIDDITALDIKVQKLTTPTGEQMNEFDFFKDMEPIIETKRNVLAMPSHIPVTDDEVVHIDSSRFAAISLDCADAGASGSFGDGWGVDDDEEVDEQTA